MATRSVLKDEQQSIPRIHRDPLIPHPVHDALDWGSRELVASDGSMAYIPELYSRSILTKFYKTTVLDATVTSRFVEDASKSMMESIDRSVLDSVTIRRR